MTLFSRFVLCLLGLVLASCDALPSLAPTSAQLIRTQDENWDAYMVKVTSLVAKTLTAYRGPTFPRTFRAQHYKPNVALKPGDTIGITVYETGGTTNLFGGTVAPLMTGAPGMAAPQASTLPMQVIEPNGTVTVPYVGRVKVAGRSPTEAAELIQQGLAEQTVRPQVVVSLVSNTANTVSVGGEVNKPGLMPLTLRGETLLDVVAWGGGPKYPAVQVDLRLMRGAEVFSLPLQQVMSNPENNILAEPNDNIVLVRNPKTILVMGASQKVDQYPFEFESMTLGEAVAKAGGGLDTITSLASIYLFRYEPGSFARTVLTADPQAVDTSYVSSRVETLDGGAGVPVVYRIDLTRADGYFFSQQVPLRDKDIILLATAQSTQFVKFMQVVRTITGAYYDLTRSTNN